jgi:hypothetical protein
MALQSGWRARGGENIQPSLTAKVRSERDITSSQGSNEADNRYALEAIAVYYPSDKFVAVLRQEGRPMAEAASKANSLENSC